MLLSVHYACILMLECILSIICFLHLLTLTSSCIFSCVEFQNLHYRDRANSFSPNLALAASDPAKNIGDLKRYVGVKWLCEAADG